MREGVRNRQTDRQTERQVDERGSEQQTDRQTDKRISETEPRTSQFHSLGPSLTTLTLVDLPGVHFANDNQRMNQVTQELVLEYIKKNKKSIIVIVSEVGDPTGDSAINLVMQKAPDYKSRTICALTKPDKLRETDDLGKKVALNQSAFTLEENRFILMRGTENTQWNASRVRTSVDLCRRNE